MAKINAFKREEGWIEVICGPMFSGKSEELLRKINLLKFADIKYVLFKPEMDIRFSIDKVKSRDGRMSEAIPIKNSIDMIKYINDLEEFVQVIAIDEVQFFDELVPEVCEYFAKHKYIVYVAGLDCDFTGNPFKPMMKLLAYAEEVKKTKAICTECGAPASKTQKLIKGNKPADYMSAQIELGDVDKYTARCRHHHDVKNKPNIYNFPKLKISKFIK